MSQADGAKMQTILGVLPVWFPRTAAAENIKVGEFLGPALCGT